MKKEIKIKLENWRQAFVESYHIIGSRNYMLSLLVGTATYLTIQKKVDAILYGIGNFIFTNPLNSMQLAAIATAILLVFTACLFKKGDKLYAIVLYVGIPISIWFALQQGFIGNSNYLGTVIFWEIVLLSLGTLLSILIKQYIKKHEANLPQGIGLVPDEPLTGDEEDEDDWTGLKSMGEFYTKRILETLYPSGKPMNSPSFVFGVEGDWGSGKTSLLNIINKELEKSDVIRLWYNPWMSESKESLMQDFFNTLADKLPGMSLKRDLHRYGKALTNLETKGVLNSLDALLFSPQNLQKQRDDINDEIKRLNIKMVVFIDDLDRMDAEEILAIFKLIRNVANFRNMVYLVAYDKNYIITLLDNHFNSTKQNEETIETMGSQYLAKIVQTLFIVPHNTQLIRILIDKLTKRGLTITDDIINNFNDNTEYQISNNPRKVIRIYNQTILQKAKFPSSLKPNQGIEILMISFIHLYVPSLYNIILEQTKLWGKKKFYEQQFSNIFKGNREDFNSEIMEKIKKFPSYVDFWNAFSSSSAKENKFDYYDWIDIYLYLVNGDIIVRVYANLTTINDIRDRYEERKNNDDEKGLLFFLTEGNVSIDKGNYEEYIVFILKLLNKANDPWDINRAIEFFNNSSIDNKEWIPIFLEKMKHFQESDRNLYNTILYELIAYYHRLSTENIKELILKSAEDNLQEAISKKIDYITIEYAYTTCWQERKADNRVILSKKANDYFKDYITEDPKDFLENIFRHFPMLKPETKATLFPFMYQTFKDKSAFNLFLKNSYNRRRAKKLTPIAQTMLLLAYSYIDVFDPNERFGFDIKPKHTIIFYDERKNLRTEPFTNNEIIKRLIEETGINKRTPRKNSNPKGEEKKPKTEE